MYGSTNIWILCINILESIIKGTEMTSVMGQVEAKEEP